LLSVGQRSDRSCAQKMVRQRRYCLIVSKGPERMKPVRMASVGIREVDERY
jgi:hypothetical protein